MHFYITVVMVDVTCDVTRWLAGAYVETRLNVNCTEVNRMCVLECNEFDNWCIYGRQFAQFSTVGVNGSE